MEHWTVGVGLELMIEIDTVFGDCWIMCGDGWEEEGIDDNGNGWALGPMLYFRWSYH
jgi:hypothetical protein